MRILFIETGSMEEKMRLSSMKVNQQARIISIDISDFILRRHLLEMGLTRGTLVKVVNIGDPISIEIRGYELALRKSYANFILVEVIS